MSTMIPILLYHSVAENVIPRFSKWAVSPQLFAAHMAYLHERHYTPMTVTQLAQAMGDTTIRLPEQPIVLTFDDGLADFYTNALPFLKRYDFTATLYIPTGFVGGLSRWLRPEGEGMRPMLTWRQIADINASGIECGGHSHSHPQLDILSPAAAREEIVRCKLELEQRLGRLVETFAYPHGYYSLIVRRLVQQAGYTSACAVKHALSSLTDDRFALARIIIARNTDVAGLDRFLTGHGLPVAPLQERLQTKGWRLIRQSAGLVRPHAGTQPSSKM
jgi:peptidoglycan/xylan/chitin deacetylase (PgdA/CDA1 family)